MICKARLQRIVRRCYSIPASEPNFNAFNIQLLPPNVRQKVFPCKEDSDIAATPESILAVAREHLQRHSIPFTQRRPPIPHLSPHHVSLIPPLVGENLAEHFCRLGAHAGEPWIDLASEACRLPLDQHPMPVLFSTEPGWTFYPSGVKDSEPVRIQYPKDPFLFFDTESSWTLSKGPLFAVALGASGWYSWTLPHLGSSASLSVAPLSLIQMGMTGSQLVIGHNISFDRIYISEEYDVRLAGRRFLDTLSLHCAVAGLSTQQRPEWQLQKKTGEPFSAWHSHSSMNNLADALKLHTGRVLEKNRAEGLQILIEGCEEVIRNKKETILQYCAADVLACAQLFQTVWKKYVRHCPHPASQAGMLMMGSMILPVDSSWNDYIDRCEAGYQESLVESDQILSELAEEVAKSEDWRDDPWLNQLDWTPIPARYTSVKKKPIGDERLFGKPSWYAKLFSRKTGKCRVTVRTNIAALLLRLTWRGYPVCHREREGWCYWVPTIHKGTELELVGLKRWVVDNIENGNSAFRIPHLVEEDANVGCLFSKGFTNAIEQGILSSSSGTHSVLPKLISLSSKWAFWTGYRERIMKQLAVIADPATEPTHHSHRWGYIIPATIVSGTVTRRAVESCWMTAGNPKKGSAGSEQKAMVRCPPGWTFVGADVDSQELWIASLLGDAVFCEHGSTAMGWMTLQGSRQDSTDLHSRTAAILGMRRDDAKIFTYGRIYGAGAKYAASLLSRFNPKMPPSDASLKAEDLYSRTKGRRIGGVYMGGTESFMFNQLERIATSSVAETPVLGCRISEALCSKNVGKDFMTSRVNWAVQSSGVDYLHLLLVSMKYLCDVYSIPARLSVTIHDEVRFLVQEGAELRAALALQISNLWVRSFFAFQLGLSDLPYSVAFFSLVDIDKVLRKEPTADCITPTNYIAIPPGRSLNCFQLLEDVGHEGLGIADASILAKVSSMPPHVDSVRNPFSSHPKDLYEWEKSLKRQANAPNNFTRADTATTLPPRDNLMQASSSFRDNPEARKNCPDSSPKYSSSVLHRMIKDRTPWAIDFNK